MERNGRRIAWLALLAALVLVVAACKGGGGGEGTGEGTGTEGEEAAGGGTAAATGGEDFAVSPGFAQMTLEGRSGGTNDASSHGEDCLGQIANSPDHAMTVSGGPVTAMLAVTSDADTTLVVLGPGGPFCNDDHDGLNPGIEATFQPGEYHVFVGNYSSDEGATPYTLAVSPAQAEEAPGTGMAPATTPTGGAAPAVPTTAPSNP